MRKEDEIEVNPDTAGILYARGRISVEEFLANQPTTNLGETLMRLAEKRVRASAASEPANPHKMKNTTSDASVEASRRGSVRRFATSIKHAFLRHPRI